MITQILYLIYFVGYCRCYFRCRRCCCPSWPTTTSTIPCSSSSSIQASSIRKSSRKAPTPTFCLWIWCKGRLLWRWLRQERKPRCQRKRCWILRCPSPWWPCPNCNLHRWSLQRLRSWCQVRRYVIPKGFYQQKSWMLNVIEASYFESFHHCHYLTATIFHYRSPTIPTRTKRRIWTPSSSLQASPSLQASRLSTLT